MEPNSPIPVVLTAYANRTFSFVTKTPPTSYLVRKALGIDKGAQNPGDEVVGTLNMEQVAAIAEVKKGDAHLANIPFEALCDSVIVRLGAWACCWPTTGMRRRRRLLLRRTRTTTASRA